MTCLLKKIALMICCMASWGLAGCAGYSHYPDHHTHDSQPQAAQKLAPLGWNFPALDHYNYHSHKTIDDYSEQLAIQLMENLNFVKSTDTVAVTSFVELDSTLKKTNIVGNHIADGLMGELQQFGMSVVDYKATDVILVNSAGDFIFSRDHNQLRQYQNIDYVLSGTMTLNRRGLLVHARIIGMESKVVVSSAKLLIPTFVLHSVYSSGFKDGIHFGG